MRYFNIVDGRRLRSGKPCGVLAYEENLKEFRICINPECGTEEVPMLFIPFVERNEYEIPPEWALVWVQERIPPPNRQNIAEILVAHDLEEYDEFTLLLSGMGRCSQDEFVLREVFPDEKDEATWSRGFCEYALVELPSITEVDLKREVGAALLAARKKAGVSQDELTRRSGIPHAMISRIERGIANPTLETLAALADGLSVEISFTIHG